MAQKTNEDGDWGRYLGYGLEMAVGVIGGLMLGRWLDRRYGLEPWGSLGCCMLGAAAGMYLLIRDAFKENQD